MLRSILILLLALWGTTAHADEKEDAAFFMTHFFEPDFWETERRKFLNWGGSAYYHDLLWARNIQILDRTRFNSMFPQSAADDAAQQFERHASDAIIAFYGPENLAQLVDFFQTPTGYKMLEKAKADNLFRRTNLVSPLRGPVAKMKDYLKFSEHTRYSSFASTPAGQFYVQQTYVLRRTLSYDRELRFRWYMPPLDQPFLIDIVEADGVLKFPNRIARDALIREIKAASS
ncbi:MAG: hypothetical protein ABJN14_01825 [Paracoccaceae bacterium]